MTDLPATPLEDHVRRAAAGDLRAFDELVRRFQDMAVGYATGVLGDVHLAQDAAQNAFLQAFESIGQVRDPAAFPGWFRRVVASQCDRLTRRRQPDTVPLQKAPEPVDEAADPATAMETQQRRAQILRAVAQLPEPERQVVTLFYMGGQSHGDIAAFLDVRPHTVNNRLRSARSRLKERLLAMAEEQLASAAPSRDDAFATTVAFCAAAQAGDLNQVGRILEARPELVGQTHPQHRHKALHLAAAEGHAQVVERLLQAGADPLEDFSQAYAPSAWVLARRAGHHTVVAAMEAHIRRRLAQDETLLTARDGDGNTLLHLAVYHRCRELVSLLLAKGADADARNDWGQRPIDLALYNGSDLLLPWEQRPDGVMAGLLLAGGATMDIWAAAALGETHLVRAFLNEDPQQANAYTGARRSPGGISCPLGIAAREGHMEAVRLLLDAGADPDAVNFHNHHDEDYEDRGAPLIMAILKDHLDIAHLLLDRGAAADVKVYAGYTALELAMDRGDDELVRRLIAGGARLWPAELAARGNYLAVAEILDRCTPAEAGDILLGGVRGTDPTVVAMSLKAGPALRDGLTYRVLSNVVRYDKRPEDRERQERMFRMILEHGVDVNEYGVDDEAHVTLLHGLSHKWWMKGLDDEGPARYAAMLLDAGADLEVQDTFPDSGMTPLAWAAANGRASLVELFLERGAHGRDKARAQAEKHGFAELAARLG